MTSDAIDAAGPGDYGRFGHVAWRTGPLLTATLVLADLLEALAPLGSAAATGLVVEAVPDLTTRRPGSSAVTTALWWIAAIGGCFLLQRSSGGFRTAAATALGERMDAA
ncbi:MAG TPA: hypothetical protein VI076_09305, partial [Actinopolymorphaceae bacterium]